MSGRSVWRRWRVAVLCAAAVAAALLVGTARAGERLPSGSYFALSCPVSHSAPADPIVYPRLPNRSHDHEFFGNVSTNAFSTAPSLESHASTCTDSADHSAYWAPTLYVAGDPIAPVAVTIYYRRLTSTPVHPFPKGLEAIAGNSHAVTPQPARVTSWSCGNLKSTFYGQLARSPSAMERAGVAPSLSASALPTCPGGTNLQLQVNFPDCSDGKADSADHKSHLAYSADGRCPSSHPIAVPAISIVLRYPPITTSNVFLASGGIYSGHADFMDAWGTKGLRNLISTCLDARRVCAVGV